MSKQQYETVWPKDVIWADAARGLSYVAGSVAKIYSSHFLEHVREKVAVRVLQECRRVLAPGGVFRLVVPDLQYYARRYVAETDALIAANEATRKSRDDFLYMACGGYLHRGRSGAHHMFMYDWPSMKLLLTELGYKDVQRCGFQQSRDAELAKLDNRPEDSLHVEMTV